jgi:hypothetical protein
MLSNASKGLDDSTAWLFWCIIDQLCDKVFLEAITPASQALTYYEGMT